MKILSLDISTKAGWALLDEGIENHNRGALKLVEYGQIQNEQPVAYYGEYPFSYIKAAHDIANRLFDLIVRHEPQVVVIEEINLGKNRYTQKLLEFIHCLLLETLAHYHRKPHIRYIDSSAWRSTLGLVLTKEEKKANAKLSKAKRQAAESGGKLDKKALGIKGKVGKKHLAVRFANEQFNLQLKMKDNDVADAICLAAAYSKNAPLCDGV